MFVKGGADGTLLLPSVISSLAPSRYLSPGVRVPVTTNEQSVWALGGKVGVAGRKSRGRSVFHQPEKFVGFSLAICLPISIIVSLQRLA